MEGRPLDPVAVREARKRLAYKAMLAPERVEASAPNCIVSAADIRSILAALDEGREASAPFGLQAARLGVPDNQGFLTSDGPAFGSKGSSLAEVVRWTFARASESLPAVSRGRGRAAVTVCVAIRVNECIVFAADSATTLSMRLPTGQEQTIVFRHGHKVFNLHKKIPVCAMTYGTGNIGRASISMLAKEFRALLTSGSGEWKIDPDTYTIEDIVTKFHRFLFEERLKKMNPQPQWSQQLGMFVGGYSANSETHEVWGFVINADGTSAAPKREAGDGVCGMNIGGDPEAFWRLVVGYSSGTEAILAAALKDPALAATLMAKVRQATERSLVWDAMPVQDAIDLANFLVETTKGFVRFLPGHDTVGGATDIAVVTKHEGFKWVQRKHYFPPTLNPEAPQ